MIISVKTFKIKKILVDHTKIRFNRIFLRRYSYNTSINVYYLSRTTLLNAFPWQYESVLQRIELLLISRLKLHISDNPI